MRAYLLVGAAALALAGAAVAQPAPPDGPRDEGRGERAMPPHDGHHMGRPGMMRRMMEANKAARFQFERGDASVDIKCAADEPMRACADAAMLLMDKLAAQPAR